MGVTLFTYLIQNLHTRVSLVLYSCENYKSIVRLCMTTVFCCMLSNR